MNINHFYKDTITLYKISEGVSTVTGENVKTNSDYYDVKCKIRPLTNFERYNQNKNSVEATHRVYCAYSTSILHLDRIKFSTQVYEIVSITDPFNKHDFLQIDARAVI